MLVIIMSTNLSNNGGLILSNKIFSSHPHNFCGALVTGKRGSGKSCYGLIVSHEIFTKLGYDFKFDAWNMALDNCIFNIEDVIKLLEDTSTSDTKERVILWDDVGVYASSGSWFTNQKQAVWLKSIMDMIREATNGLIMTTPAQSGILSFLLAYDDFLVQISYDMRGGFYRNAKIYRKYSLPSGKRLVFHQGTDHYSAYLPNWVFKKYTKKRKECWLRLVSNLKKSIKE